MPDTGTEVETVTANPETFKEFDNPLAVLTSAFAELQQRKPDAEGNITRMTVEMFQSWDTDAKKYLEDAEASPQNQTVKKAWAVARDLSAWFKKATEPVSSGREWASRHIFGPYDVQVKARAAKEQREREAAAKAQQEAERAAEVANLKALGHTAEAKELKATPLPPVSLPPAKAETKIAGRSTKTVWIISETDPVSDWKAFYHHVAEHPELWACQTLIASKWKTLLTNAKGQLIVPGLRVTPKQESANRG
jgi:hypothetical protein